MMSTFQKQRLLDAKNKEIKSIGHIKMILGWNDGSVQTFSINGKTKDYEKKILDIRITEFSKTSDNKS